MKRMLGTLNRRTSQTLFRDPAYPEDSPEAIILREVTAFCESGGDPSNVADDYLHLPAIVEAAESSPIAAKEAAVRIRKYLSSPAKPQGYSQYNAIMLIRILSDNPGHTFNRNIDAKFVATVKDLLREGRDMSAQQMLREMLDLFEVQKSWDDDLAPLIGMWKKEKERIAKYTRQKHLPPPPPPANGSGRPYRSKTLPPPDELAARISEAKTSASLLIQLAQSTPTTEVPGNELMKEFSERCQAAARSVQGYMKCDNPPPDEDTLLTLIETSDQLSVAMSRYQRAVLNSRKALSNGNSQSPSPAPEAQAQERPGAPASAAAAPTPAAPVVSASARVPASAPTPDSPPTPPSRTATNRYEYNPDEFQVQNPFADPDAARTSAEEPDGTISPIDSRTSNQASHAAGIH